MYAPRHTFEDATFILGQGLFTEFCVIHPQLKQETWNEYF